MEEEEEERALKSRGRQHMLKKETMLELLFEHTQIII